MEPHPSDRTEAVSAADAAAIVVGNAAGPAEAIRIAEQPADQGFLTEALMSAIAQSAPEAKARVRDFLEGRAAKVQKSN